MTLKNPDEIAAIVIEHLPDSTRIQRHLLDDLLIILGEEQPLHGAIAERLHNIEFSLAHQLPLALQFRERARNNARNFSA